MLLYFKKILCELISFSFIKTLIFNLHYFGLKGLTFPVIIGKRFKLRLLQGTVTIPDKLEHKIYLGKNDFGWMNGIGTWKNKGHIHFEGSAYIGNGTRISVDHDAHLYLGDKLYCSGNALISCDKMISIGDDSMLSWNVTIMDNDAHKIMDASNTIYNFPKDIHIGSHVWIGCDSHILKGSSIPNGSIVAAASTISKSFSKENILLGETNRILKEGVFWKP